MTFRLIPLDDAIVFPTVTATLPIEVGEEERVFLIPRHEGEYGRVGVVAEVIERGHSRRGHAVATVVGLHRGLAGAAQRRRARPRHAARRGPGDPRRSSR